MKCKLQCIEQPPAFLPRRAAVKALYSRGNGIWGHAAASLLTVCQVDVENKRCEELGCNKRPNFGTPSGRPQFCKKHKSADMVSCSMHVLTGVSL